jgi:hypothetical protein
VPTAERDATIGLSIFEPIFRGVRGLMYNSPEEKTMIQAVASNEAVPSVVVGVGSEVPPNPQPARFRQKFNLRGPYAIYVGRIDENKGCKELFGFFERYLRETTGQLTLVLIGHAVIDIPSHPRIRHLGFVDDADKFDGIAGAELLLMPSYYESLSMVALEAWALGKPVLANARCDVLKGQCLRSNAGLWYEGSLEFIEALRVLERNRWVAGTLGRNGRQFYRDHYDWPVIERKYLDMLDRLSRADGGTAIEPLPGMLARRRQTCPPGMDVVNELPSGPTLVDEAAPARPVAEMAASPTFPPRTQPDHPRPSHGRDRRDDDRHRRDDRRPDRRDDRRGRSRFRRGGSRSGNHR